MNHKPTSGPNSLAQQHTQQQQQQQQLLPFSIDRILSSPIKQQVKAQNQPQQPLLQQQQQQQEQQRLMLSLAAAQNNLSPVNPALLNPSQPQPTSPLFLSYVMAIMLIQQQQQQQQLQQHQHQQQHQTNQHRHQLHQQNHPHQQLPQHRHPQHQHSQQRNQQHQLNPQHHHQQVALSTPQTQQINRVRQTESSGKQLDNMKPAHSYIGLIAMCILSTPEKRMVLNDIYQFILDHYPYYRNRGSGWRNSVRHNLSLNECFQKDIRAPNGKGHYWCIHPANMADFMNGDFRRRRAQRQVRRHNNMEVPSDESDDESMEDAARPPLPEHFKRSLEMHRQLELIYGKQPSLEVQQQQQQQPPQQKEQPKTLQHFEAGSCMNGSKASLLVASPALRPTRAATSFDIGAAACSTGPRDAHLGHIRACERQ